MCLLDRLHFKFNLRANDHQIFGISKRVHWDMECRKRYLEHKIKPFDPEAFINRVPNLHVQMYGQTAKFKYGEIVE